jgi:hypothetical protein
MIPVITSGVRQAQATRHHVTGYEARRVGGMRQARSLCGPIRVAAIRPKIIFL